MLLFSFISTAAVSQVIQKEASVWYFGLKAGIDFNTLPPQARTDGQLSTSEGCATICNKYGNLLFYTDGVRVYDKTHTVMPNGTGLTGNPSSTQSGIIVPNPDSAHIYYVFSTSGGGISAQTAYSIVDTTLNSGKGDIKVKNVNLLNLGGEKLTAVKHSNGKDFWVITHQSFNDSFYVFLVTGAGVSTTPVISETGFRQSYLAVGYLKASPNGQKLVGVEYINKFAELFDFNTTTGVISNARTLDTGKMFYGAEFSPSGDYLYITSTTLAPMELVQYNLRAGSFANIRASRTVIKTFTSTSPGALQLGPDGKIYMSLMPTTFLSMIDFPEKSGSNCDYTDSAISLNGRPCHYGLPTFIQSFFKRLSVDITVEEPACGQLSVNMWNTGDTGKVINSFWDFGDGTTYNNGLFVSKTYAAHGTYNIKNIIHIGGDFPRVDTVVKTIKTKQLPKAGFNVNTTTACLKNNAYQFTDTSKYYGGSSMDENVWAYTDITSLPKKNMPAISRRHTSTGLKGVKLKITSNEGCSDSVTTTYIIKPDAKSVFTVGGDQCFNTNRLQPSPLSTIDTPAFISGYTWKFGDGTSDTNTYPYKVFADTGIFAVSLITFADNGCHDTAIGNFAVNPSPKTSIITTNVCQYDSLVIKNTSTITAGTLGYKWWYGDGHTDTVFEKNRLYKDTGIKLVKLVATSEMFCKDSITVPVRVIPSPKADFSISTLCDNINIAFIDKTQRFNNGVLENKWFFGDGVQLQNTGNTQHLYNDTGGRTIKLYTKSASGCDDSIEKRVYVSPRPQVSFYINDSLQCLGGNYFTFSESVAMKRGSVSSYQWKFNDIVAGTGPFWGGALPSHGLYEVKLIAITDSGCVDSSAKQVTVWPQASLSVAVNDTSQCLGDNSFILTNNSTIQQGTLSYLWKFSSGNTYTTATPPPTTFSVPGVYMAWLLTTSNKGCTDSLLTHLFIEFNPKADFVSQTICENDSAYFINTTSGDASGWEWHFGDGATSTAKEPIHKYAGAGIYKVTLIGRSANGCGDTLVKDSGVVVSPAPKVYFTTEIGDNVAGNTNVNFINKTLFGDNFSWAFGNGGFSRAKNPSESYKDTGYFKVILSAINNFNCFDEFDTLLYLAPDFNIVIPNAFTPNKDPLNPTFTIEGTYYYKEYEIKIFDRWGKLLFLSHNPAEGWNGEYEDTPLPDGVYIYTIRLVDYLGKVRVNTGALHLMR